MNVNKRTIWTALILAGISTAGSMIRTYWHQHCTRKTMELEQELWKERYAINMMSDETDNDE